ncbi:MAG: helix-turn-helix domain-containing protein [Micromonosporaceae bacterium]
MADTETWADVGERVRQVRLANGLSQSELAQRVGLDRTMLAKVEGGARRLDALELARLASALNVPMDHFLSAPPAVLSRRTNAIVEAGDTEAGRESNLLDVVLSTWLHNVRQLIEYGLLTPNQLVRYPEPVTSQAEARKAAQWLRDQLGLGREPIATLMEVCERAGQYLLVTRVSGDGASLVDDELAVAVVSHRGDPGRRRTTAAHELGHLVLGDEYSTDLGVSASRQERETAVDAFAAELLLPADALVNEQPVTRDRLVRFAALYRTSWILALRQAEVAGAIDRTTRRRWSASNPTHAEFKDAVGWAPQPDLDAIYVPPGYAHAVMTAWRRDLIGDRRAVELLHGQITEADLPSRDEVDTAP